MKKENIVKKVCKELGITQKELAEKNKRIKVAEELIKLASVHESDIDEFKEVVAKNLEEIKDIPDVRNIIMNEEVGNIIKYVCEAYNLTYAQLAKILGYKPDTISKAASTGKISEPLKRAIELYLENLELQKQLEKCEKFKNSLKDLLS